MDFQRDLLIIGNSLSGHEVKALAFLCSDIVGRNVNSVESASQLFTRMADQDHLSNERRYLLTELLVTIRRIRLATGPFSLNDPESRPRGLISSYRKLLFELSEEITDEDLRQMKFLLHTKLPRRKLDESVTTLEVFLELEHMDHLSETNMDELKTIIHAVCPVLVEKINQFQREQQTNPIAQETGHLQSTSLITNQGSLSSYELTNPSSQIQESSAERPRDSTGNTSMVEFQATLNRLRVDQSTVRSDALDISPEETEIVAGNQPTNSEGLQTYSMSARTRGVCLIINNYKFTKPLKDREGTEIDENCLRAVFEWLGFHVDVRRDRKGNEMRSLMLELSRRDHSGMDSVVCCILSHGKEESVLGVDGAAVTLTELRQSLNGLRCPSLANKPKLFFIQACQGTNEQDAVHIESDGNTDSFICSDAIALRQSIPSDADFMFAMSTVPSCLSYRDKRCGTWFIQSLCRNLVQMVPRGCDLVSILTKVNSDVSQMSAGWRKQMPQPQFTLTKKVVFPAPNAAPPRLPSV